jgi:hypothetical protein
MEVKDGKGVRHLDFNLVAAGKVDDEDDGLGLLMLVEDDDDDIDDDDDNDSDSGKGDVDGDGNGDDDVVGCSGLEAYWWPFDDWDNGSVEVVDAVRGEVVTGDCRWLS